LQINPSRGKIRIKNFDPWKKLEQELPHEALNSNPSTSGYREGGRGEKVFQEQGNSNTLKMGDLISSSPHVGRGCGLYGTVPVISPCLQLQGPQVVDSLMGSFSSFVMMQFTKHIPASCSIEQGMMCCSRINNDHLKMSGPKPGAGGSCLSS
jgi:hypothetical protein